MQLSRTLPKVPQDLFDLKKNNTQERLRRAEKQQPLTKSSAAALRQNPGNKRQAVSTNVAIPALNIKLLTPSKRARTMTARMHDCDAQLNMLKTSLTKIQAPA